MTDDVMLTSESFAGEGADAAHVNTVLGSRNGPVGVAGDPGVAAPARL